MTITLTPEIEQDIVKKARELGTTPEALTLEQLRRQFAAPAEAALSFPFEPQDEWERKLLNIGKNCGISLSNEAVSSEGLYGDHL